MEHCVLIDTHIIRSTSLQDNFSFFNLAWMNRSNCVHFISLLFCDTLYLV